MAELPPLPAPEAQHRILHDLQPLPEAWVPLEEALGFGLTSDVLARRTQPPWDNSAMDGYAVRSADVARPPVTLPVVAVVHAGDHPTRAVGPGEAVRIMTGAPMPPGADAVVMQERTRSVPGPALGEVEIQEAATPRQNVRDAGEDARAGEVLLPAGTVLGIPELALLASQGMTSVRVPRRPRVAIVATGDELCRPDEEPQGRIVDTNSVALALGVRRAGGAPVVLGIARDRPEEVEERIRTALDHDVVLTSAGASVGEHDHVRPALERLGVAMDFWRVAIKPGKPLAFGRKGATRIFALPGNPASSLVTFELFVRPALLRLVGRPAPLPVPVQARSGIDLKKNKGLAHFVRVVLIWREGEPWADPLPTQTSGAVRSAVSATHLLHFPMDAMSIRRGEPVELLPVGWAP
ncbi:MAG: molybdopterin molybdenumtransferase MoeA [Myxococcaceae bacterium]|nr:MAG: molybdopterin molybdenumtransferase MoeA [Myxococcaceae bacterium]